MFLKTFTIEQFKGFTKTSIDLGSGVNVLVGPNNCGKSSLLQGIFLSFRFLDHYQQGKKDDFKTGKGVSIDKDQFHLPYPDKSYISTNLKKQSQFRNPHTGFLLDFIFPEEKEEKEHSVKVELLFSGNNTNIYVGTKNESKKTPINERIGDKKFQEKNKEITEEKVCFVPLFAGLIAEERGLIPENVKQHIWTGRSNEVLRNKIYTMNDEDRSLLKTTVKDIFGISLSDPSLTGADLQSHYQESEKSTSFDVFAGGSGFQQILHLLVYILSSKADIVLIDEPDAHLHFDLQKKMFQALRNISLAGKKQIIIATHSFEIIQAGINHGDTKVFLIDKKSTYQVEMQEKSELARNLYENGVIGTKTLLEFTDKMTFLVVENQKEGKEIFERFFEKKYPEKMKDALFQIIDGKGNGKRLEHFLAETEERNTQEITQIFVRDSDGLTSEEEKKIIENEKINERKTFFYIEEFEVENWLLKPSIITRLLNKRLENEGLFEIQESTINTLLEEVLEFFNTIEGVRILEGKIRGRFRAHRPILFPKKSDEDFDRESSEEAQRRSDEIRKKSFDEKLKYLPGKEVFKLLKNKISKEYGIQISELDIAEEFQGSEIPIFFDTLFGQKK